MCKQVWMCHFLINQYIGRFGKKKLHCVKLTVFFCTAGTITNQHLGRNNALSPGVSAMSLTCCLVINTAVLLSVLVAGNYIIQVFIGLIQCLGVNSDQGGAVSHLHICNKVTSAWLTHSREWRSWDQTFRGQCEISGYILLSCMSFHWWRTS